MKRVLVLVEGPTERAVVDQVFAPHLGLEEYIFISQSRRKTWP